MNVFNGSNVAHVAIGDNLAILRTYPDKSIHACITSPPYYGLRDYGHDGQIGLEDTPDAILCELNPTYAELVPDRIKSILTKASAGR